MPFKRTYLKLQRQKALLSKSVQPLQLLVTVFWIEEQRKSKFSTKSHIYTWKYFIFSPYLLAKIYNQKMNMYITPAVAATNTHSQVKPSTQL